MKPRVTYNQSANKTLIGNDEVGLSIDQPPSSGQTLLSEHPLSPMTKDRAGGKLDLVTTPSGHHNSAYASK